MRLAYPWLLAAATALAAAALAAAWRLERRRARLPYPAEPALRPERPPLKALLARWLPLGLKSAALLLLAFALARPQSVKARAQGAGRGIDIMLVLDVSLSMGATDFDPNRLEAAKSAAVRFVGGRAQDRIGALIFGGAPQLISPATVDYEAVIGQIRALEPGMTKVDGTAIGDGLASAVARLRDSAAKSKVVILLTDGRSNAGVIDPLTAAKAAASYGIKVYTIGTAKKGPAMMPIDDPQQGRVMVRIDDDLDDALLGEVARLTDAKYFRATSLKEMREIWRTIDALEKSEVELPALSAFDDLYRGPAFAAALLLLAEAWIMSLWLLSWP